MLSIVSVPIGNLGDITLRAIEALRSCDAIVCEDTRVTGKLLSLLELPKKELIAAHSYTNPKIIEVIIRRLRKGEHLCLVSDAGTPGISDPGYILLRRAAEEQIAIEAIPGASAFLAALSVSGLPMHHFTYLGFLPLKKGRQTMLKSFAGMEHTIVFYESPHRIVRTLGEIHTHLSHQPERPVVIARELTKMHEELTRTSVKDLPEITKTLTVKGEFTVIIGPM